MKRSVFIIVTFALLILMAGQAHAGTVNLRLGPEGEILAWLVVGPFANPGTEKMTCRGLETDYLFPSESEARPVEGQTVASTNRIAAWRLALADTKTGIDFLPLFAGRGPGVAYAYAAVKSPLARDARLLLGSDDGVKVWVNGELVHTIHATRGVKRDSDRVDIRLNEGVNRLLFKVDQHFGGWGLLARIAGQDGKPIPDLVEQLDIQASGKSDGSEIALVRTACGKPGALDVDALSRYVSWRRKTQVWMPWFRTSAPHEKALGQIARKVDAAKSKSPEQMSKVLADMAGFLEMQYAVEWEALTKRIQNPEPLVRTNVVKEDYIRVAPGGRYFVHANGSFFTPIGYNQNPEWAGTEDCAPGSPNYDPAATERFFKRLHESGVNFIRMMLEAPAGGLFLENPVGTFNPEQVAFLDNIVTFARKYDIKLMITPWDTFWMNHTWDGNPYNSKNGGPVVEKVDFETKREVIEGQKKRWKFIIDRWGNSGTIFSWELFNECDLWWGASAEQVQAWTREMGDYVRDYEKRKWGRNHIITISIANAMPGDAWGDLAYRQAGLDLATTHLYIGAANAPDEPIGPALAEQEGVTYAMTQIKDNRPYIDSENGPINRWIVDEKLDDLVFHNMSWAHMASGGAGSGLRWPYRNPHHLSEGMYQGLKLMRRFADAVPWRKLTGPRSEIKVTVPNGWIACSTGTKNGALIWITSAKPSTGEISISWPNAPKSVKYRCYDTQSGEWLVKAAILKDKIPLDGRHASVAIIVEQVTAR